MKTFLKWLKRLRRLSILISLFVAVCNLGLLISRLLSQHASTALDM